eukprot:gene33117-42551_t
MIFVVDFHQKRPPAATFAAAAMCRTDPQTYTDTAKDTPEIRDIYQEVTGFQIFDGSAAATLVTLRRGEDVDIAESTATEAIAVLPEIHALFPEILENRRWFHAHPELSFEEVKTAAHIVEILRSYGIEEIHEQVGRTGVVALIRGTAPSASGESLCIALRADIDALPITETATVDYASKNPG